jgi:hypothetical protein
VGLEAVRAAFDQSRRLRDKHAARALLIWMAFNVLDEPRNGKPALTFWGGYKTAAIGLGYSLAELDDSSRAEAALTAVKRTMRVLETAGLIEKAAGPAPGRTKEWLLTLQPVEAVDNQVERSARGGRRPTGTEVEDRPEEVGDRPVQRSKTDRVTSRRPTSPSGGPDSSGQPRRIGRARALEERQP